MDPPPRKIELAQWSKCFLHMGDNVAGDGCTLVQKVTAHGIVPLCAGLIFDNGPKYCIMVLGLHSGPNAQCTLKYPVGRPVCAVLQALTCTHWPPFFTARGCLNIYPFGRPVCAVRRRRPGLREKLATATHTQTKRVRPGICPCVVVYLASCFPAKQYRKHY